jgi:hypothetical protein
MKIASAAIVLLSFILIGAAHAETVVTRNLHTLQGTVVLETDDFVELSTQFGTLRIPRVDIVRIDPGTAAMSVACSDTAEQSKDFADKMRAEGKVLYHGRWVTPEEKDAQEASIAESKRLAAQQMEEERRQAEREAQAQAEVEEQIRREERRYYIDHALPSVQQKLQRSGDFR